MQAACRAKQLSTSGTKAELHARLLHTLTGEQLTAQHNLYYIDPAPSVIEAMQDLVEVCA